MRVFWLIVATAAWAMLTVAPVECATPKAPASLNWTAYGPIVPFDSSGTGGRSGAGEQVVISGSGTTLATFASATGVNEGFGVVWVYVLEATGSWVRQTKLVGTATHRLLGSVALSWSGDTMVVGTRTTSNGYEAYVRRNGAWSRQGKVQVKPQAGGIQVAAYDGLVSISGLGKTIAVSCLIGGKGAVLIFFIATSGPNSGQWVQKGKPLFVADATSYGSPPVIQLDFHGNVLAASSAAGKTGITFFARDALGTWVFNGSFQEDVTIAWANSLALSGDGRVCAAGRAVDPISSAGVVWVWEREQSGKWVKQQPVLTAKGTTLGDTFGYSLALSYDGSVLFASATTWYQPTGGNIYRDGGQVEVFVRDKKRHFTVPGAQIVVPSKVQQLPWGGYIGASGNGKVVVVGCTECAEGKGGVMVLSRK